MLVDLFVRHLVVGLKIYDLFIPILLLLVIIILTILLDRGLTHVPFIPTRHLTRFSLNRRLLHFETRGQFPFTLIPLMEQVVDRCHLIVLVVIQAIRGVFGLETELFEVGEHAGLNRDFILSDDQALVLAHRLT